MKKISILFLVIFLIAILTGCSSGPKIQITEDEKNAIAQYSAYLLMKYDVHGTVQEKLLDKSDLQKQLDAISESNKSESSQKNDSNTSDLTDDIDIKEETEQNIVTEPKNESDLSSTDTSGDSSDVTNSDVQKNEEVTPVTFTLSEAVGLDNFDLTFSYFEISDSYKGDNEYFSLTPPQGKHLALVHFDLKNLSNSSQTLDASTLNVNYYLKCKSASGSSYSSQSVLSLLEDDLQYYYRSLAAGETRDTVLVFYIEDGYDTYEFSAIGDPTSANKRICSINIY